MQSVIKGSQARTPVQTDTGFFRSDRLPELLPFYIRVAHKLEGHTETTQNDYRLNIGYWIRWLEQNGHSLDIRDITAFDLLGYMEFKKSSNLSPRYIRSIYQNITTFMNWCVKWEVVPVSPFTKITPPKVPKKNKGFLKHEQFQAIIDLCPPNTFVGARNRAILWVLITTGMRHAEIHGLRISDLDWEAEGGMIRIRNGKGQKDRFAPFALEAQRPMTRYMAFRNDPYPNLWVTEERVPLGYSGIATCIKRLFERAGIQVKDVLHIFRRTWAAQAERAGIPSQYILATAGWEDRQMLDHYTREMRQENAVAAFKGFSPFGS